MKHLIAIVIGASLLACPPPKSKIVGPVSTSAGKGVARFVNPFVGTDNAMITGSAVSNGGSGSTYPGAAAPFGMVQWSPDTPNAAPQGYFYEDSDILGFSLTHLNGAGCPAQRDFPVMPIVGAFDPTQVLTMPFKHSNEIASPGFYEVTLDSGVKVDLTATQRSGMGRFTFPAAADSRLLITNGGPNDIIEEEDSSLTVTGPDTIEGSRTDTFCMVFGATKVYMAAQFDRPFTASVWGNSQTGMDASGIPGGLALTFDTRTNPIVHMKIGLSYVSTANARANLAAENSAWDFDAVHSTTLDRWNSYLGLINAQGGTDTQSQNFYSALYHVFLQPAVFSDVDGEYFGFDQMVHPSDGRVHYANFSGWDIYRSWIQLVALLAPHETSDIVRSFILDGQQGGALPRWAYGAGETGIMIGDPADVIIANAYAFGATDFDTSAALMLMTHGASDVNAKCSGIYARPDLSDYLNLGFCPSDAMMSSWGSSATTMEYAIADFSIAQLAQATGDTATATEFKARGRNWRNVFDTDAMGNNFQGYPEPRLSADANGQAQFQVSDPASGNGFVEGSSAQYAFQVPQDLTGLDVMLGGDAAMTARLDNFFTQLNAGTGSDYFYMGNEPGFAIPWEYPWTGAPWRTQDVVHRIVTTVYTPTPAGLPGNEDLGAMSSWLVWGMLGMYPEIPGVGGFVLASPSFPEMDVTLPGGQILKITAANLASDSYYVQSVTVNGEAQTSTWLPFSSLQTGGTLAYTLGAAPNMSWGSSPVDRPPATYP